MTTTQFHTDAANRSPSTCDPATRVTKSLLGYGIIAGPFYLAAWLGQAFTRPGFHLDRHAASLLTNGSWGWVQALNFVATGLMVVVAAGGLRRWLQTAGMGSAVANLITVLGVGVGAAGIFHADPAYGFPPGTPAGKAAHASWHGNLHYAIAALGFLALIAATFVAARQFARRGDRTRAMLSGTAGTLFLLANLSGSFLANDHQVAYTIVLTIGIVIGFAWLTTYSLYAYRRATTASETTS
jgi:hypothetical membrane protein